MTPPACATVPRRIPIVGGEASGKTSLGRRVASIVGLPSVDLNTVAWQSATGAGRSLEGVLEPEVQTREPLVKRPLIDRATMVEAIAARPAWVVKGFFLEWTEPLFERVDLVIWLDHVPFASILRRVAARHVRFVGRSALAVMQRVVRYRIAGAGGSDPEVYASITRSAVARVTGRHAVKARHATNARDLEARVREQETLVAAARSTDVGAC